jgi:hypothetical protein
MAVHVKLDDIIQGLEAQSDESQSFLDKRTGQVVFITDEEIIAAEDQESLEDYPDWQQESIKIDAEILQEKGDYIELPSKFDINEYRVMEDFCLSLDDIEIREHFCDLIRGSGAFRRFKNEIYRHGISDNWFKYRNEAIKQIAVEWCRDNEIEFDDK